MANRFKVGDEIIVKAGLSKKIRGLHGTVMYIDGEYVHVDLLGRDDYDKVHYTALEYSWTDTAPTCLGHNLDKIAGIQLKDFCKKIDEAKEKAERHNEGKPELSYNLINQEVNELEAKVWAYGAEEYERGQWVKGQSLMEAIDSLQRHTTKLLNGQDNDDESGLPHAAHIITCAKIVANSWLKGGDLDDRPAK